MDAGTLELVELELLLDEEHPCSSSCHADAIWGHVPDEGAAWRITAPCGAAEDFCDGGWQTIVRAGGLRCIATAHDGCAMPHNLADLDVRPI